MARRRHPTPTAPFTAVSAGIVSGPDGRRRHRRRARPGHGGSAARHRVRRLSGVRRRSGSGDCHTTMTPLVSGRSARALANRFTALTHEVGETAGRPTTPLPMMPAKPSTPPPGREGSTASAPSGRPGSAARPRLAGSKVGQGAADRASQLPKQLLRTSASRLAPVLRASSINPQAGAAFRLPVADPFRRLRKQEKQSYARTSRLAGLKPPASRRMSDAEDPSPGALTI